MPGEGDILFKDRNEILEELVDQMTALVPDAYMGEDGNLYLVFQVFAGSEESVFLAIQVLSEDMFIQTANESSLEKWGSQLGRERLAGTKASGEILVSGEGGGVINIGDEVSYDPENGDDPVYFLFTESGVIPNPGIPGAVGVVDSGAGNLAAGTYEYAVTFLTDAGETELGQISASIVLAANRQTQQQFIPVGGPGTIGRRIYRRVNGGDWGLAYEWLNNTTTQWNDNNATTGTEPPAESTAERILLAAEAEEPGTRANVLANTITEVGNMAEGVNTVANPAPFTGGSEPEEMEEYRARLLRVVQQPETGSSIDMQGWAEDVEGVDSATVYENDNVGTPTNGHVTVRIAGPNGAIPDVDTQLAVYNALVTRDLSNVTIHVATFTQTSTDVTVDVSALPGFLLADLTPSVQTAIANYINSLQVGETLRISGIIAAVFGLPGVQDVTVTTPASNQATGSTAKRTPGTITVT